MVLCGKCGYLVKLVKKKKKRRKEMIKEKVLMRSDFVFYNVLDDIREMNSKEGGIVYGMHCEVLGVEYWFVACYEDCVCLVKDCDLNEESVLMNDSELDRRYVYVGNEGLLWEVVRNGLLVDGIVKVRYKK